MWLSYRPDRIEEIKHYTSYKNIFSNITNGASYIKHILPNEIKSIQNKTRLEENNPNKAFLKKILLKLIDYYLNYILGSVERVIKTVCVNNISPIIIHCLTCQQFKLKMILERLYSNKSKLF